MVVPHSDKAYSRIASTSTHKCTPNIQMVHVCHWTCPSILYSPVTNQALQTSPAGSHFHQMRGSSCQQVGWQDRQKRMYTRSFEWNCLPLVKEMNGARHTKLTHQGCTAKTYVTPLQDELTGWSFLVYCVMGFHWKTDLMLYILRFSFSTRRSLLLDNLGIHRCMQVGPHWTTWPDYPLLCLHGVHTCTCTCR